MYRIFVVEDDSVIAGEICRELGAWGFEARSAEDFADVLGEFRAFAPHLVLMDVSLPFHNGYFRCAEIRKESKVPVIFISSRSDDMEDVYKRQARNHVKRIGGERSPDSLRCDGGR